MDTVAKAIRIPLEAIESSNLSAFGYDVEKQILAVQFKSGAIFHYAPFPQEQMWEFYNALSKGTYYATHIKGKVHGQKMTGECPKCGDKNGWIGDTCTDCGCAAYEDTRRPVDAQR
jgi:hypothetical protein